MSCLDYRLKSLFFKLKSSQHIIHPPSKVSFIKNKTHRPHREKILSADRPIKVLLYIRSEALFLQAASSWMLLVSLETTKRRKAMWKSWELHGQWNNKGWLQSPQVRSGPEEQRDSDPGAVYNFDFTTDWLRRFCKSLNSLWCSCLI